MSYTDLNYQDREMNLHMMVNQPDLEAGLEVA